MLITDIPERPFEKIQFDLVGPLPATSRGKTHILTIQCIFFKCSDSYSIQSIDTATIAQVLAEQFIARYVCLLVIHSDQGSNFISQVNKNFCKYLR